MEEEQIEVFQLQINGQSVDISALGSTPLLWILRDYLDLTGTKYGCGMALCGACTVQIDGQPTRTCLLPVKTVVGKSIVTIEGLQSKAATAVQQAWADLNVVQCGYCQSGQIVAATALLEKNPAPTDADIDAAMNGNLCRCATYMRIRQAIKTAAQSLAA